MPLDRSKEPQHAADNQPSTIDGSSFRVIPTPPTIHLKTIDDIRLEMAKVYRDMKTRQIETQDGTRLVYVLSQIGKMIQSDEVAKRVEALELVLEQRKRVR